MRIFPVLSKGFSSNRFFVMGEKTALIDAGMQQDVVDEAASNLDVDIDYLILTHCHFDHVALAPYIKRAYGAQVFIHELEAPYLIRGDADRILSSVFSKEFDGLQVDGVLGQGEVIDLGENIKLEVIYTPGHSEGGISLYEPDSGSLFTGDTMFRDGIGRSDFPGGDPELLIQSLKNLYDLHLREGIRKIYAGHGPVGTGRDIEKNYLMYAKDR